MVGGRCGSLAPAPSRAHFRPGQAGAAKPRRGRSARAASPMRNPPPAVPSERRPVPSRKTPARWPPPPAALGLRRAPPGAACRRSTPRSAHGYRSQAPTGSAVQSVMSVSSGSGTDSNILCGRTSRAAPTLCSVGSSARAGAVDGLQRPTRVGDPTVTAEVTEPLFDQRFAGIFRVVATTDRRRDSNPRPSGYEPASCGSVGCSTALPRGLRCCGAL